MEPTLVEKSWVVSGTCPRMDLLFVTHPQHREQLWRNWPQMMSRVILAPLLFSDEKSPSRHWVTTWAVSRFYSGDLADVADTKELIATT